jgi:hypothetical protein
LLGSGGGFSDDESEGDGDDAGGSEESFHDGGLFREIGQFV